MTQDFIFTRFPFSLYNRIKPKDWYGLNRAKGTINGLLFMFDLLGLHGYANITSEPRFTDNEIDFQLPLTLTKFHNCVTIGKKKIIDKDRQIIFSDEEEYLTTAYDASNIIKTGISTFMSNYDRKLVTRLPFSWDRNSQRWNRFIETISTYARRGDIVYGYYYYLTGYSAAGEPLWLIENTVSSLYLLTYDNAAPFIQIDTNKWINSDYDAQLNNPTYIESRTILANINNPSSNIFAISYDNGKSFKDLNNDALNQNNYEVSSILNIKNYSDRIYAIGKFNESSIILFSNDVAKTWSKFITSEQVNNESILDIFHDIDARVIYLLTSIGLYKRYDLNQNWIKVLNHDTNKLIDNTNLSGTIIKLDAEIFVSTFDRVNNNLIIQRSFNEGLNWFTEYSASIENENNNYNYHRTLINAYARSRDEIIYLNLIYAASLNNTWFIIGKNNNGEYIEFPSLNIQYIKDLIQNDAFTITDIQIDLKKQRFIYLVVSDNKISYIISSDTFFKDLKIESINYDAENIPLYLLIKTNTVEDLDIKIPKELVINNPKSYLILNQTNQNLTNNYFNINIAAFESNDLHTREPSEFEKYHIEDANNYLTNFKNVTWSIPNLKKVTKTKNIAIATNYYLNTRIINNNLNNGIFESLIESNQNKNSNLLAIKAEKINSSLSSNYSDNFIINLKGINNNNLSVFLKYSVVRGIFIDASSNHQASIIWSNYLDQNFTSIERFLKGATSDLNLTIEETSTIYLIKLDNASQINKNFIYLNLIVNYKLHQNKIETIIFKIKLK